MAARVQLSGCYILYEVSGFAQISGYELLYKTCGATNVAGVGFQERRDTAFSVLENGVLSGHGFYTTSYQAVYMLAQCEGDLGDSDCGDCVKSAVQRAQVECGSSISGQVYLHKCFISYNYYPNGVPKRSSSSGTGGNTGKTVAIILGGAAGVGFLVICLLFARNLMKKHDGIFLIGEDEVLKRQSSFELELLVWTPRPLEKDKIGHNGSGVVDCISADLGPSTSESVGTSSLRLSHPLRKATKAGSEKGANAAAAAKGNINSNGDCLMDVIIDGEFRQRVDESGTVLATDKQLDKNSGSSSSLLSNQWEAGRSDGPKDSKREVMQNGLMSMLTRGLEETVVSHWDGIELPPCQTAASNDVESTSIGYVLDECSVAITPLFPWLTCTIDQQCPADDIGEKIILMQHSPTLQLPNKHFALPIMVVKYRWYSSTLSLSLSLTYFNTS
uniref:Gnk2-homologous domain-containing protein n=1 Tax=Fagus sylvatica TaxID=28930 RepID=A0A2N9HIB2_FAGSY